MNLLAGQRQINVRYGWNADMLRSSTLHVNSSLRPDGFAMGLFLFGLVLLFVPLLAMPGLIAMLAAPAYWLTMVVVQLVQRRRS